MEIWYMLFVGTGELLDISGAKITASSHSQVISPTLDLSPELAIQADTSYSYPSCFLSKKEPNPCLTIEFKSLTTIFNVRLGVRKKGSSKIPIDFNLERMDKLSVYVSNSSALGSIGEQQCGNPWVYRQTKNILLDCGKDIKGKFVHITVPSISSTSMLICFIVFNREKGLLHPLSLSEKGTTVVSSGYYPHQPPTFAIDGLLSSCTSVVGEGTTWLRVDIKTTWYIREVRLLFGQDSGKDVLVFVGRGLRRNGRSSNTQCHAAAFSVVNGSNHNWVSFTCDLPVLGQFIYIQKKTSSMQICEINFSYDKFLNIYSPVDITASDQKYTGPIWKPIDGTSGTSVAKSWVSLDSSQSWWRMELSRSTPISAVVVYTPDLLYHRKNLKAMDGFAVYIGNSVVGNGSKNAMCGKPWKADTTSVITFNCKDAIVGKYVYVSAAGRYGAAISLSEVSLYQCEPRAVILKKHLSHSNSTRLTCQGSRPDCVVTHVAWVGPDGNRVKSLLKDKDKRLLSTIDINSSSGRPYTCKIAYVGGSARAVYTGLPYCGQAVTGLSGTVTSSGFPSVYPNGLDCYIYIRVPSPYRIRLAFDSFELEEQDLCLYDSIEVFDGDTNESDKRFGKYCGANVPPVVVSSSNELLVHFVSDDTTARRGFRASYRAVTTSTPTVDSPTTDAPTTDMVTTVEPVATEAVSTEHVDPTGTGSVGHSLTLHTTENAKKDCLDVVQSCLDDPFCVRLFLNPDLQVCAEVLQTPPGLSPHCTKVCRELVLTMIDTGFGLDMLQCNCSTVQDAYTPIIGALCRPFQLTGLEKCDINISTMKPVTVPAGIPTTVESTTTEADYIAENASAVDAVTTEALTTETVKQSCMSVVNRCFTDPSCVQFIRNSDLPVCLEILLTPQESPPYCTEKCRGFVLSILDMEFGRDLLHCDCSTVQSIPIIKGLCRPFQLTALAKCNITISSTNSKQVKYCKFTTGRSTSLMHGISIPRVCA
jgi:hypothetical protein